MEEERKRILKMIEEGMLSADEASELLDALDDAEKAQTNGKKIQSDLPSTKVDWKNGEQHQKDQNDAHKHSTKDKIFDFIDSTVKKIKNADFDFNFGSYKEVSHIFQYQETPISSFQIEIDNGSVDVQTWNENEIRIECQAKVYKIENYDLARAELLKRLKVQMDNDRLNIVLGTKKIKADFKIFLPNHIYQSSAIKMFNGPVSLKDLQIPSLKVKTSNGKIHLQQVEGEDWEIESMNSNICLERVKSGKCEIETMNGSVKVDGEFKKIDSQLMNGNIQGYLRGMATHSGYFKTTTGSIHLHVPADLAIDGELKSSIGNVKCHLPNHKVMKSESEVLKKQVHFQSNVESTPFLYLEAESKTGSVRVNPLK
ncbi:DUF4097 family beta strand repeat-containing protein [Salinibacillus xinjiangensis]|uniref:DUF4097 family beta strand repeat protein n=1 Tax=Salinibacillus xinjiangensis TaxID=1229268 RepID=A0A6G1X1I4_9BACI|nr:DUF4097 domain-containing protein [Salinibacillus xinjiangensis]MRG84746.1 DUF4097 family beta strand repeat protein [Salinibacillus xinjiangensis]